MTLSIGLLSRARPARSSLSGGASPPMRCNGDVTHKVISMFRITTRGADGELVLMLEGYLTGPWVSELEGHWQRVLDAAPTAQLRVDLTGLCRVDSAGRELLTTIHRSGARLVAKGCVMPVLVREIAEATAPQPEEEAV